MTSLFTQHTQEQHANSLASFLPDNNLFVAKNIDGKNLRKFLVGLAAELKRTEDYLYFSSNEKDARITTNLIEEWESAVGIPDNCFSNEVPIDQRRLQVLAKMQALGVSTAQDYIDLAALIGYDITISYPVEQTFYPPYDVPFSPIYGIPESRYVFIVTGIGIVPNVPPYDVPFSLNNGQSIIQCLFDNLKPANSVIIYRDQ